MIRPLAALAVIAPAPFAHAEERAAEPASSACVERRGLRCPTPAEILAAANGAARQRPDPAAFVGARQVYAYAPGGIYELNASTRFVSAVMLEPGEAVTAIAAGDTARWMVTEALSESAAEPRAVVLIKPLTENARTNIVIITDRRTYLIEARSGAGDVYAAEIAWSYPQASDLQAPSLGTLNFAYRIRTVRGARPAWAPARVFDDGVRTYIEFAPGVAVRDMAPIFVITAEGAELANYRVVGRRVIVDRLFERAELRLGVRSPVVVRIDRAGEASERRRPRRGGRP